MKLTRRITMICLLFALLLLSGCAESRPMTLENAPVAYDTDPIPLTDVADIEILSVRCRRKMVQIKFRNNMDDFLYTTPDNYLEVFQDGDWYRLQPDPDYNVAIFDLYQDWEAQTESTMRFSLRYYGLNDLEPGQYRVTFQAHWGNPPSYDAWVYIPFEID